MQWNIAGWNNNMFDRKKNKSNIQIIFTKCTYILQKVRFHEKILTYLYYFVFKWSQNIFEPFEILNCTLECIRSIAKSLVANWCPIWTKYNCNKQFPRSHNTTEIFNTLKISGRKLELNVIFLGFQLKIKHQKRN